MHDFQKYPELTNQQLETEEFASPHIQIKADFTARVEKVVDGDTIHLSCQFRDFTFPLRFLDIDAPELNEENGKEVQQWLKAEIEGREVEIKINRHNRVGKYGRLLGKVYLNGMDMGEIMQHLGMAVPFGKKNEGHIPKLDKVFDMKQWF